MSASPALSLQCLRALAADLSDHGLAHLSSSPSCEHSPSQEFRTAHAEHADDADDADSATLSQSAAIQALLAHQQPIPRRAISPERVSPQQRSPVFDLDSRDAFEVTDPTSRGAADGVSDSDSDSDSDDVDSDDDHIAIPNMASAQQGTIFTTYTSAHSRNQNSAAAGGRASAPASGGGFSSWLSRGSKPAALDCRTPSPAGTLCGASAASITSPLTPASLLSPAAAPTPSRLAQLKHSVSTTLSRFSQPSSSAAAGNRPNYALLEGDEFYHMDVQRALFPSSDPFDHDPFAPTAFKNLEANAMRTLTRIHAAYRQRALAMLDLAVEKSTCEEELEGAETRARNFKVQLESMAQRAAQQEADMKALAEELAAEKKAHAQERAMFLAGLPTSLPTHELHELRELRDEDQSTNVMSEDLGVEEAQHQQKHVRQWRKSIKSSNGSYDDTDDYDDDESVFSRSRSPATTPSLRASYDGVDAPPIPTTTVTPAVPHPRVAALGSAARQAKPASPAQLTTFQKLVKNVTGGGNAAEAKDDLDTEPDSCRNCRGQDVSFAWNTVSILRDENKQLKQRVGQLEVAVEGALDVVQDINY